MNQGVYSLKCSLDSVTKLTEALEHFVTDTRFLAIRLTTFIQRCCSFRDYETKQDGVEISVVNASANVVVSLNQDVIICELLSALFP